MHGATLEVVVIQGDCHCSTEPAFANSGTKGPPSAIHKPDASREQTSHLFTLGELLALGVTLLYSLWGQVFKL